MSSSNSIGDFDLNVVKIRKPLEFPDGTIQTTSGGGGGGNQNLQQVLTTGNNAGGLSMTNIATINGSAYPPATSNIQQVLTAGNDGNGLSILNLNDVDCNTVQSKPYPPDLGFVMGSGATASANLDMDNFAITNVSTINGVAYPPPSVITLYTPTLLSADTASGSEFILTTQVVPAGTYTISASVMINVNSSQYLQEQLIEMGTESGGIYTSLAGISGGNGKPQFSQSGIILTQTFTFAVQSNVFVSTTCVCNASATWRTITAGNPSGSSPKSYVSILRVA